MNEGFGGSGAGSKVLFCKDYRFPTKFYPSCGGIQAHGSDKRVTRSMRGSNCVPKGRGGYQGDPLVRKGVRLDFKVQHLFRIQSKKRNQGTLIETGRNRPVSRNQTAILAGTLKSIIML